MVENIANLNKIKLITKHRDILKFYCYNDDNKLCNKLSSKGDFICNKCSKKNITNKNIDIDKIVENYQSKEQLILKQIKDYLEDCESCTNKSEEEPIKMYKVRMCLEIYKIIYYNPMFYICNSKFLITIIKKATELLNVENKKYFIQFLKNQTEYTYIFKYMSDIELFCKTYETNNNIILENTIKIEDYTKFLDQFVLFLNNYYQNIINNQNKETENEPENKPENKPENELEKKIYEVTSTEMEININNLCECSFILEI